MPSTAVHPGADHQMFWLLLDATKGSNTILPIHHPFWDQHRPGDHWLRSDVTEGNNCHCSLEATDEHPTAPPKGFELRGNGPQPGLNENPAKTGRLFAQSHPYFPQSCAQCAFYQGGIANGFKNAQRNCENCPGIAKAINKGNFSNVTDDMKELHDLKGKEYYQMLQKITQHKIYKEIEKGIYSAINESDKDFDNLLSAARKAVDHGYKVYLLPNPSSTRSGDFILKRKNNYKLFDLKTVSGKASIDTQLLGSIGQTQRVFLNMTTKYSTRRMAGDIKKYFDQNEEALEVVIAIGKKMVSIERDFVSDKHFYANLRKLVE